MEVAFSSHQQHNIIRRKVDTARAGRAPPSPRRVATLRPAVPPSAARLDFAEPPPCPESRVPRAALPAPPFPLHTTSASRA
jgi:hypothetical protein